MSHCNLKKKERSASITENGEDGIELSSTSNTTIADNIITTNYNGIHLAASNDTILVNNTIIFNTQVSIYLEESSTGNLVYHNDVLGNGMNAKDTYGWNAFNSQRIGNYWGNYTGIDANEAGIGDTSYIIGGDGASKDNLPAMTFFHIVDKTFPSVTIDLPENSTIVHTPTVRVEWTDSDELAGIDHFAIRITGNTWREVGMNTTYTFTDLDNGKYTVDVKAFDRGGNTATTSVTSPFTSEREKREKNIGEYLLSYLLVLS